jgi:hypothetical protein
MADTVMNTTEKLCSIAAEYVIDSRAAQLHPAPSSSGKALPDVIIQDTEEGTTTIVDDDGGINNQAGISGYRGGHQAPGMTTHGPL